MNLNKKYSYWIHSGKYTAIQKFSTLSLNVFSFMLLARILGPEGFGIWGLFMVVSSIAETARTALIRNAFIRFIHQSPLSEEPSIQTAGSILSLLVSMVLSLLFLSTSVLMLKLTVAPEFVGLLRWYSVIILVSSFFSSAEMLLNAKLDFKGICFMYVMRQGLFFLAIFAAFLAETRLSLDTLALFYLISFLAATLIGLAFCRKYSKVSFTNLRVWLPKLLAFGKFVFGTNIFSLLFRSTDNFVTFKFFGAAISGYYNACLRISNLIDLPSQVIADLVFPKVAKFGSDDKSAIKHMYEKSVGAVLVFSIPALVLAFLFPSFILRFLAGESFVVATPLLRITLFFGFTLPFLKQFGTVMDATGNPHLNFRVMLFAFVLNVINNLIGVYVLGLFGAAIGTAVTYFVIFMISQYILNRKFNIKLSGVFMNTFHLYGELINSFRLTIKTR